MSSSIQPQTFSISLPRDQRDCPDQDGEWCEVSVGDAPPRRLRFHDYGDIYQIPGLYESLFHHTLRCTSPQTVCGLLSSVVDDSGREPGELRVLDLGAGNGLVGQELRDLGVSHLVGVDIIEDARCAAERDRPGLYNSYLVADMCDPDLDHERHLRESELNCLTSVAALGFGDIPPRAFANAYNFLGPDALVAFNIRDRFLDDVDASGYRVLINRMLDHGVARPLARRRYRHRLSMSGEPLYYVAVVAEKVTDVPDGWT